MAFRKFQKVEKFEPVKKADPGVQKIARERSGCGRCLHPEDCTCQK